MTTKEQERKALGQIKEIIDHLGPNSYVGTAFDGCFEIAEENIRNDTARNVKYYIDEATRLDKQVTDLMECLAASGTEIGRLEAALDKELEWRSYIDTKHNISQDEYDNLAGASGVKDLSDEGAIQIIADEFGFEKDRIMIVREIPTYEINRHGQIRQKGTTERNPVFYAWDWYYIRFNVRGNVSMSWEVYGGDLHVFDD